MTRQRFSTPTWGAARPTPSAAYMVSAMSSSSLRMPSSTRSTGWAISLRTGSGQMTMSRTMAGFQSYGDRGMLTRTGRRRGAQVRAAPGRPPRVSRRGRAGTRRAGRRPPGRRGPRPPRCWISLELGGEPLLAPALEALRVELGEDPVGRLPHLVRGAEPAHAEDGEVVVAPHLLQLGLERGRGRWRPRPGRGAGRPGPAAARAASTSTAKARSWRVERASSGLEATISSTVRRPSARARQRRSSAESPTSASSGAPGAGASRVSGPPSTASRRGRLPAAAHALQRQGQERPLRARPARRAAPGRATQRKRAPSSAKMPKATSSVRRRTSAVSSPGLR